jgi:hypothetical protein
MAFELDGGVSRLLISNISNAAEVANSLRALGLRKDIGIVTRPQDEQIPYGPDVAVLVRSRALCREGMSAQSGTVRGRPHQFYPDLAHRAESGCRPSEKNSHGQSGYRQYLRR